LHIYPLADVRSRSIEGGVRIWESTVILPGLAIVAGAVDIRDVAPGAVAVGNPARSRAAAPAR
jgi:acetyltransferase-like isoleucine patch superfamily enzyme